MYGNKNIFGERYDVQKRVELTEPNQTLDLLTFHLNLSASIL